MAEVKSLNALEPFLALSKSISHPSSAAQLIQKATSAPSTYIFQPLLSTTQISSIQHDVTHANSYELLRIFCYGTYADYARSSGLPALSPAQTLKLRQLSLLSFAATPKNLTYNFLITSLALTDKKELEHLVISSIYAGLITATLDPCSATVLITSVAPLRDVAPASISGMIATLQEWQMRCDDTLASLENNIAQIRLESKRRAEEQRRWDDKVKSLIDQAELAPTRVQGGEAMKSSRGMDHAPRENKGSRGLLGGLGHRVDRLAGGFSNFAGGGSSGGGKSKRPHEMDYESDDMDMTGGERDFSRR